MINIVVVLEMILQAPLVLESAKTHVAEDAVTLGVVDMVFETISVLKDANAEIAVVLMAWCLLYVALKSSFVREPDVAGTTPVLMRIVGLVARYCHV